MITTTLKRIADKCEAAKKQIDQRKETKRPTTVYAEPEHKINRMRQSY